MGRDAISKTVQRQLVDTWREAGKAMEAERLRALASQTPEESRDAALDMLELGSLAAPKASAEKYSGLMEMQRLFARWHRRDKT
ncbi:MAG TPA: hypothetical protein VKV24_07120 [Casimicrobiaceae bacterium]|nr:hypothetical protein [Casimicrobiaceae bacterium]